MKRLVADLRKRLPLRDQPEDLPLAIRDDGTGERRSQPDLADEPGGGFARKHGLAARDCEHALENLFATRLLREISGGPCLERLVDDAALVVGREKERAGEQAVANDRVDDRDAVHFRQLVIEQGDVRLQGRDLLDRPATVVDLRDHLYERACLQNANDPLAKHRVVVRNEHAHMLVSLSDMANSMRPGGHGRGAAREERLPRW